MDKANQPKKVWMKCRAYEKCEGKYAHVVFAQHLKGQIDSASSGRIIRYKCCTCGLSFQVRQ